MKSLVPALALFLGGCAGAMLPAAPHLVVPVVVGGTLGVAAEAVAINIDADFVLDAALPFDEGLCLLHPWSPQSQEAEAAITAFCDHLPTSTIGMITQFDAIVRAVDAAASKKGTTP